MGHSITALILKGEFDKPKAESFDLKGKDLGFGLTLFHIDHYYAACWQYSLKTDGQLETPDFDRIVFPTESALAELMKQISCNSCPQFAIIQTDYFGGIGAQYASVFCGSVNADKNIRRINEALKYLGVVAKDGLDEFDTVGLDKIHSSFYSLLRVPVTRAHSKMSERSLLHSKLYHKVLHLAPNVC